MVEKILKFFVIPVFIVVLAIIIASKAGFLGGKQNQAIKEESKDAIASQVKTKKTKNIANQIGGDFSLINQHGERVSTTKYFDKYKLIYFGFTNCPGICPTDLTNITSALNQLGAQELEKIQPIFVSIDPDRDKVEVIKDYLTNFHPKIEGFTGTNDEIVKVIKDYKVFSEKVDDNELGNYLMNHTAFTYLIGKDSYYITHFNHNENPEKIVEGIRKNIN